MSDLKPCPFCGGEAERYETDAGCVKVNCRKCHIETPWGKHRFETDDIDKWNRRAPEPGTSVIRWTRYDGTPETLPEEGEEVLFHGDEYGYEVVVLRKCPALIWTHFVYAREMREHFLTVNAGDLWSYLPEPPEGPQ